MSNQTNTIHTPSLKDIFSHAYSYQTNYKRYSQEIDINGWEVNAIIWSDIVINKAISDQDKLKMNGHMGIKPLGERLHNFRSRAVYNLTKYLYKGAMERTDMHRCLKYCDDSDVISHRVVLSLGPVEIKLVHHSVSELGLYLATVGEYKAAFNALPDEER